MGHQHGFRHQQLRHGNPVVRNEVLASCRSRSSTRRRTDTTKRNGLPTFVVVNILGFFIDRMQGNDVVGYITEAPGTVRSATAPIDPSASFLAQIQLIR